MILEQPTVGDSGEAFLQPDTEWGGSRGSSRPSPPFQPKLPGAKGTLAPPEHRLQGGRSLGPSGLAGTGRLGEATQAGAPAGGSVGPCAVWAWRGGPVAG